ncbi:transketolase [Candidatus Magnetaquicoccus inordinatus]|uniref:transketolase n=1 Tax=Candidatus Magnetaquicoccus inordinatus TaxID=2496818 RepID=UPI00187D6676
MDERSRYLRRLVFRAMQGGGRGHPGSALSLIEIVRVLYDHILQVRPGEPQWPQRDRCILSKGHGCLALYAILADKGFFPMEELDRFCRLDAMLGGHPELGMVPGVEASTGALGHGLSIAAGMALAAQRKGETHRVMVILGDGELDEGSVWEAAMFAAKHRLQQLTALVDYNKLQSYGAVTQVQPLEPLADKWRAFGFAVAEVDGHDPEALRRLLQRLPLSEGMPSAILCHTVKGKGVPMAEHNPDWHHKSSFKAEELAQLQSALGS